jgi:hypothetical protein
MLIVRLDGFWTQNSLEQQILEDGAHYFEYANPGFSAQGVEFSRKDQQ